ncbi:MAG: RNA polymerase sigma factor [Candidatus Paceibacterota bacterium]
MDNLLENYRGRRLNRLAKKMQKGDAGAAEEIYKYFANRLFGFLFSRTRSKPTAEDLAQDIFLKLVSKVELFDPKLGNFSSWFWQLARNTLIDYYRSSDNKKSNNFSELKEEILEEASAIDESRRLENKIELNKVFEFLKTLQPEEQEIFEMRFIAQLSFREISRMLDKSEGSLRISAMRIKNKIKDNLK